MAAPLLLLRTLLGMDEVDGRLMVEPALPEEFTYIGLLDVPGRWGVAHAYGRGRR